MTRFLILLFALFCNIGLAFALPSPHEKLPDPALENRAVTIMQNLRCVLCQNQSIIDSNADIAKDMREKVRAQIMSGMSDADITNYFVTRYGDYVVMTPPKRLNTAVLWFGPLFILLALGGAFAKSFLRTRNKKGTTPC